MPTDPPLRCAIPWLVLWAVGMGVPVRNGPAAAEEQKGRVKEGKSYEMELKLPTKSSNENHLITEKEGPLSEQGAFDSADVDVCRSNYKVTCQL